MSEHHDGPVENIACCFVGEGRNNLARSLRHRLRPGGDRLHTIKAVIVSALAI